MEEEAGSDTSDEDSEDSMTEQLNGLLKETTSKSTQPPSPTLAESDDESLSEEEGEGSEEESVSEELSSGDESAGDDQVSEAGNEHEQDEEKKDLPAPSLAIVAADTEKTTAIVRNSVLILFQI